MCKQKFSDYNKSEKGMLIIGILLIITLVILYLKFTFLNNSLEIVIPFFRTLGNSNFIFYNLCLIIGIAVITASSLKLIVTIFFPDTKEEKELKLYKKKVKKENKNLSKKFINKKLEIFSLEKKLETLRGEI